METSVVIGFLRGHEPEVTAFTRLLTEGRAVLTAISVFELAVGFSGYGQLARQLQGLGEAVRVLPLDEEAARLAGYEEFRLRRQGVRIGTADILIAGICLRFAKPIVTLNAEHFRRVPGLHVLTPDQVVS